MFVLLTTNIVLTDEDERLIDRTSAEMAAEDRARVGERVRRTRRSRRRCQARTHAKAAQC
jgi:hypothetical protein